MRLTDVQVREFRREGVLVAEGVLTDEDLAPVIAEYETWIERRARQLQAEGKIAVLCEGEPFERRFASLYAQCHEIEHGLDLMQARLPAAFALMRNENLLDRRGVIFMHRHTPHRSTPNFSDTVRWSIDLRYQPTSTPTGRPFHPAFVARSRAHPEQVLTDHAIWCRLWEEALARPQPRAHRVR